MIAKVTSSQSGLEGAIVMEALSSSTNIARSDRANCPGRDSGATTLDATSAQKGRKTPLLVAGRAEPSLCLTSLPRCHPRRLSSVSKTPMLGNLHFALRYNSRDRRFCTLPAGAQKHLREFGLRSQVIGRFTLTLLRCNRHLAGKSHLLI